MIDPGKASLKRTLGWLVLFLLAFYFAVDRNGPTTGSIDIVGLAFTFVCLVFGSIEAGRVFEAATNPPQPPTTPR